jgi:hypothetical protein
VTFQLDPEAEEYRKTVAALEAVTSTTNEPVEA